METNNMDMSPQDLQDEECAQFQALMAQRIEAGEDLQTYEHMKTCERCPALIRDLEALAEACRLALAEPEIEPADEVWRHIEEKIRRGEA